MSYHTVVEKADTYYDGPVLDLLIRALRIPSRSLAPAQEYVSSRLCPDTIDAMLQVIRRGGVSHYAFPGRARELENPPVSPFRKGG